MSNKKNKKKTDILNILKKVWRNVCSLRIKPADAAVTAGVLLLSCLIILPSIFQCIENRDKAACEYHMNKMLGVLSKELNKEAESGGRYWQDMLMNGNYQKLLSSLNEKTGEGAKYPASHYYIRTGADKLFITCKKHKDISEKEFRFSAVSDIEVSMAEKPVIGERIIYLAVSGPDTYYQNSPLDPQNPDKMLFSGTEIDDVIQDLRVYAVYMSGYREELSRERYTIIAENLDMSKAGQTEIIIKYNPTTIWDNSVYVPFVIDVIGEDDVAPLIVDAGINGRYEIAAWDWQTYVDQSEAGMEFGASIVRYKGRYYYYPDGFYVVSGHKNSDPFKFAVDLDDWSKSAYYIEFDMNSVVLNKRDEKRVHAGSLKAVNDLIYIWQDRPSREFPEGWLRVYCEYNKF